MITDRGTDLLSFVANIRLDFTEGKDLYVVRLTIFIGCENVENILISALLPILIFDGDKKSSHDKEAPWITQKQVNNVVWGASFLGSYLYNSYEI